MADEKTHLTLRQRPDGSFAIYCGSRQVTNVKDTFVVENYAQHSVVKNVEFININMDEAPT